jgi:hypothetical protein
MKKQTRFEKLYAAHKPQLTVLQRQRLHHIVERELAKRRR